MEALGLAVAIDVHVLVHEAGLTAPARFVVPRAPRIMSSLIVVTIDEEAGDELAWPNAAISIGVTEFSPLTSTATAVPSLQVPVTVTVSNPEDGATP